MNSRKLIINFTIFFLLIIQHFSFSQNIDSLVSVTVSKAEILRKDFQDYEGAIKLLKERLEILENVDTIEKIPLAPLYHKLGVNFYYLGRMNNALKFNSIALKLREDQYGENHIDVIKGYFNRGSILRKIQDYTMAKRDLDIAISRMEDLLNSKLSNDTIRLMRMYTEMYIICLKLKDNKTAMQYWELTHDFYSKEKTKNVYILANLFNDKGTISFNEKKYQNAIDNYLKAIELFSLNKERDIEVKFDKGLTINNLANSELKLDNINDSKRHFF